MLGTIAWKVTSRLAVAASRLPRPLYFRLLLYVLQPLLDFSRRHTPSALIDEGGAGHGIPAVDAVDANATREESGEPAPVSLGKRRALVIDGFTPTPDKDAASTDIYWFMRILLGFGYDVTFVPAFATAHAGRYTDDLRALGVVCPVAPVLTSADEFIVACGHSFDLIVLYRVTVADGLIEIVRQYASQAKVVFNTVDLHFLRDQRQAEVNGQLTAFVEAKRRETRELAIIRSADAVVLLSEFEYDYIGRHAPGAHRFFIPLAMPVPGLLAPYDDRNGVMFVGGFAHAPNVDAVHLLCGAVWPLVRRLLPNAKLFVVGSNPPPTITAYHAPAHGIEIMGFVEDLTILYRSVRVTVAPLRYGAGLKGKVVASLAVGVPCVVTSIASEGMPPGSDGAIIVADAPEDFARGVADIYSSPERWSRMSDAGIAYARENFSVEAVAARVRAMLKTLGL